MNSSAVPGTILGAKDTSEGIKTLCCPLRVHTLVGQPEHQQIMWCANQELSGRKTPGHRENGHWGGCRGAGDIKMVREPSLTRCIYPEVQRK